MVAYEHPIYVSDNRRVSYVIFAVFLLIPIALIASRITVAPVASPIDTLFDPGTLLLIVFFGTLSAAGGIESYRMRRMEFYQDHVRMTWGFLWRFKRVCEVNYPDVEISSPQSFPLAGKGASIFTVTVKKVTAKYGNITGEHNRIEENGTWLGSYSIALRKPLKWEITDKPMGKNGPFMYDWLVNHNAARVSEDSGDTKTKRRTEKHLKLIAKLCVIVGPLLMITGIVSLWLDFPSLEPSQLLTQVLISVLTTGVMLFIFGIVGTFSMSVTKNNQSAS